MNSMRPSSKTCAAATDAPAVYYPPRAGARKGWLLRAFGRLWAVLLFSTPGSFQGGPLSAAAISLVPGAGRWRLERRPESASMILAAYLALLFVWLLSAWDLAFMAMLALHQWAVADSYFLACENSGLERPRGWRAAKVYILSAVFLMCAYSALGRVVSLYGTLVVVTDHVGALAPILSPGDNIFIQPRSGFKRGDLVYGFPQGQPSLGRVAALPGETLRVAGGTLYVDGRALTEDETYPATQDVFYTDRLKGAEYRVPDGYYCVFFHSKVWWDGLTGRMFLAQNTISKNKLKGVAAYRIAPNPGRLE